MVGSGTSGLLASTVRQQVAIAVTEQREMMAQENRVAVNMAAGANTAVAMNMAL